MLRRILLLAPLLAVGVWGLAPAGAGAATPSEGSLDLAVSPSESSGPGLIAYTTDSNYYQSSRKESLSTVLPSGASGQVLVPEGTANVGLLSFSPSGGQLAYLSATSSTATVKVMTLATRAVTSVFSLKGQTSFLDGMTWAADGADLIVGSNEQPRTGIIYKRSALWSVPVAGGRASRLTGFVNAGAPARAPNGDLAYVASSTFSSTSSSLKESTLWLTSATGTGSRRLLTSNRFMDWPSVSPSGQTIVLTVIESDTTSNLEEVSVADGTETSLTPVVKGRSDVQPAWSPDGGQIAFLSSRAGRHAGSAAEELLDAYVMAASGGGVTRLVNFDGSQKSVGALAWGA
jgi:Tol biopolymer transport system component